MVSADDRKSRNENILKVAIKKLKTVKLTSENYIKQ